MVPSTLEEKKSEIGTGNWCTVCPSVGLSGCGHGSRSSILDERCHTL